MPISILIALLIAFGLELPPAAYSASPAPWRILGAAVGVLVVGILAFALGVWVAARVSGLGYASARIRRSYTRGLRFLTVFGLATYAWMIHHLGWSTLVLKDWGLEGSFLVDDLAVFAPFVLIQLLVWSGVYHAERAFQEPGRGLRLESFLWLKSRLALGLTLPVILIFFVRHDVLARLWPAWQDHPLVEPVELAVLGCLILSASPAFVLMAWPTRSLPPGRLRRRLDVAASRAGFRFTDVRVWDTNFTMVNACVTGVLPQFRYVLLTDAMIECLSPEEIAAVFGHELGHVAHNHLPYFGFFFLGSLGVLSLVAQLCAVLAGWVKTLSLVPVEFASVVEEVVLSTAVLAFLGVYLWLVFGRLSRRFERQADVYGCRTVSCGSLACPPHIEPEAVSAGAEAEGGVVGPPALCPTGIRIFSQALATVALRNGIDTAAPSWRHGSIASRLAALEGLRLDPGSEARFQRGVRNLRVILAGVLLIALVVAVASQGWGSLP
jgi:STE24 endopeptidase